MFEAWFLGNTYFHIGINQFLLVMFRYVMKLHIILCQILHVYHGSHSLHVDDKFLL